MILMNPEGMLIALTLEHAFRTIFQITMKGERIPSCRSLLFVMVIRAGREPSLQSGQPDLFQVTDVLIPSNIVADPVDIVDLIGITQVKRNLPFMQQGQ
jgi:hypothetical protein